MRWSIGRIGVSVDAPSSVSMLRRDRLSTIAISWPRAERCNAEGQPQKPSPPRSNTLTSRPAARLAAGKSGGSPAHNSFPSRPPSWAPRSAAIHRIVLTDGVVTESAAVPDGDGVISAETLRCHPIGAWGLLPALVRKHVEPFRGHHIPVLGRSDQPGLYVADCCRSPHSGTGAEAA